jgi:cyclophilin family peptidyl-prolyl cis-trans isomerase
VKAALDALPSIVTAGGISSIAVDTDGSYVITFAQPGNQNAIEFARPGTVFHRLADLNDDKNPETPAANSSFIFQGGDPQGTGFGGPGFTFENEFRPAAIFAGRGQLAMANSGYNSSNLKGSNGSQFFITDAQPRHLDFNHTIFGQLTHGWELLQKLKETPRSASDAPLKSVRVVDSSVIPQYQDQAGIYNDAVLILSSAQIASATITVTATDTRGNSTSQSFTAQSFKDPHNAPPFIRPLKSRVVQPGKQANYPFEAIDLEYDYIGLGQGLLNNGSGGATKGFSGFTAADVFSIIGNPKYQSSFGSPAAPIKGALSAAISATQFDPSRRDSDGQRDTDDYVTFTVGVGEKAITPLPVQLIGAPAVLLNDVVVARYQDTDGKGTPADVTAKIHWGDGFGVNDAATVSRDAAAGGFSTFRVNGSHKYRRAGTYTIVVTLTSTLGLNEQIRSTAVITEKSLTVSAGNRVLKSNHWANREIARFQDITNPAPAVNYPTTIDWGDGVVSAGTVRALGAGQFAVFGSHTYKDPEDFAYSVRVHKNGLPRDQDAIGWGRMEVSGFQGQQHLPPFDQSHLIASISQVAVDKKAEHSALKPVKQTEGDVTGSSQTYLTYQVIVLNSGNKTSSPAQLSLLLSTDTIANLQPMKDEFGAVTSPADRVLEWGPPLTPGSAKRYTTVYLPALKPGAAKVYYFEQSKLGDYRLRLPKNETGSGYNFLAHLEYTDALAAIEPIDKSAAAGPIQGIFVSPRVLHTSERGTSQQFQVTLDKKPKADVTIPLGTFSTTGAPDSTEGELDRTKVVFTPDNWFLPQVVTVTGKSDSALPTTGTPNPSNSADGDVNYIVGLLPAQSADPLFNGQVGPTVLVTNTDIDSNIVLSKTTLTTTEAAGTNHQGTFTMRLKKVPTAPVTVEIFIGDETEGEIILPGETQPVPEGAALAVTFTPEDALTAQTITVQGKADGITDGNITYSISFRGTSDDPEFNNITPRRISVTNNDGPNTTSTGN